jgi:hypothetical protein
MEQFDLLRYIVRVLEDMGLHYFVTGSTATIYYGEPRFTNDIDVVVELPPSRITEFCGRFSPEEFYVSEDAARQAALTKSQFNIIHPTSGLKVDVIVPDSSPFNQSRFARAKPLRAAEDLMVRFASPEDAIIKKMEYYKEGGSEKHIRDITGVLKVSRGQLDLVYITQWSQRIGVGELWESIQKQI